MHVLLADINTVGEAEATLLDLTQSGGDLTFQLNNVGVNTMNYRFDASPDNVQWTALGLAGSLFYSTLMSGQSRTITLPAATQRVRLVGNASGGAILDFSITRFVNRPNGGTILNF